MARKVSPAGIAATSKALEMAEREGFQRGLAEGRRLERERAAEIILREADLEWRSMTGSIARAADRRRVLERVATLIREGGNDD